MRIAIIGTGISGLTTAYLLHRHHDITLFEANNYIGGHTNTVTVDDGKRTLPVDTGFIVFNSLNYPNLCKLFDAIDVDSRDSDMSFSVHCEKSGLEYNGTDIKRLFTQKRNIINPKFIGMLKDILRFHKHGPAALQEGLNDSITVNEFTKQHNYSESFIENYLIPLGASLWSCPAARFRDFPMRFVLEFLDNHCMLQVNDRPVWRTVKGGSSEYIKPMTNGFFDQIHLNTPVAAVIRHKSEIEVQLQNGEQRYFNEVILACHADQSLRLIQNPEEDEQTILSQFEYQDNDTVLHTDTKVLPEKEMAWASWNYRIPQIANGHVTVSYNMNQLQGLDSEQTYCVSLNQSDKIDENKIIKRFNYHHPVFKPGRDNAQSQHSQLIRRRGISYCGAYWGYGFHEDGVRSALSVCDAYGQELR